VGSGPSCLDDDIREVMQEFDGGSVVVGSSDDKTIGPTRVLAGCTRSPHAAYMLDGLCSLGGGRPGKGKESWSLQ
jgi:hypothetical protein